MFDKIKTIIFILRDWIKYFIWFVISALKSEVARNAEFVAMRSQLSLFQQSVINKKIPKPNCTHAFRQLWVLLSKFFSRWKSSLIVVKPETVIEWHKKAFKLFWTFKSRKKGRPQVPPDIIAMIKRIHKENPLLSPEKIYERLVNLNIKNVPCPNSIAKYIPETRKPPSEKQVQSWRNFLKNHSNRIWACDFFVVPTLTFKILYGFIIINHSRRKIEHFAVTTNPDSDWLVQQMREATPYDHHPDYIIHDSDPLFTSAAFKNFLTSTNIKSKRTGYKSPWQNGVAERAIGIIRQELLNHIIPINEKHLRYLLREFITNYYNPARTHQGINCETPIPTAKLPESDIQETFLIKEPILNGLYHSYKKAS
jgi:putative transposase